MYNNELEYKIASILYHNPHLLGHRLINREDFFTDVGDAVEKMLILHDKNSVIDKTTVGVNFKSPEPDEFNKFEDYVRALKSLSFERRLSNIGEEITKIALRNKVTPEEKLVKMKDLLDNISFCDTDPQEYLIANFIDEINDEILEGKPRDVIATGIDELDEILAGGLRKGDFMLIAADTGQYKSTTMYNICLNVAKQNKPVIIFSYENTKKEIVEILISMIACINSKSLKAKAVHNKLIRDDKEIMKRIETASNELKRLPLYIVDIDANLTDIKLMALKNKVELIAIDYIQIMPETMQMGKTEAVGRISRTLKMMTKPDALDCPIVGLSQFTKEDKTQIRRRSLNDLKDSSGLQQDPNVILFTEKQDVRLPGNRFNHKINIRIMKQRNGETGEFNLDINPMYHTIKNSGKKLIS
jgi:replicative DNA helicase